MSRKMIPACLVLLALMGAAIPATSQSRPIVTKEVKLDVSPPVRNLSGPAGPIGYRFGLPEVSRVVPGAAGNLQRDPVLQTVDLPEVSTTNLLNFDGLAHDGVAPPDTNGSVGGTQFVETVNVQYAVYDKTTGTQTQAPKSLLSIFS